MSTPITLARPHRRRLRDIYRSAGWPCHDNLEIELLAAGLVERRSTPEGRETPVLPPLDDEQGMLGDVSSSTT